MKPKQKVKIAVDALMTVLLLFLMGYQFWGDTAHEWAGAAMFALFLAHHALNAGWYRGLLRGRYTAARVLGTVINLALLAAMLGLMVSGVMLSNHVFAFLGLSGGLGFARLLHMAAAYWGFVLMALHLGLHWGMFLGMARRALGWGAPTVRRRVGFNLLGAAIAVYGLTVFVRRALPQYMLLRTQFVFLDFGEPLLVFYADYLAMMGSFIFAAYHAAALLRGAETHRKEGA